MHGLVHIALRAFVLEDYGEASWDNALREADVKDEQSILDASTQYPDSATVAVVVAATRALQIALDKLLHAFGEFFVHWLDDLDQLRVLDAMGDTLEQVLTNVNALHHTLSRMHSSSEFPTLGVSGALTTGNLLISYASVRGHLLEPFLLGVLQALSERITGSRLRFAVCETPQIGFNSTWRVTSAPSANVRLRRKRSAVERRAAAMWHSVLASGACCRASSDADSHSDLLSGAYVGNVERASGRASKSLAKPAWMPLKAMGVVGRDSCNESDERLIGELDDLLARLETIEDAGAALMRSVPVGLVAAGFDDLPALRRTSKFWESNVGELSDYNLSRPASSAMRFVSHTWTPPADWAKLMGAKASFDEIKAASLASSAQDLFGLRERILAQPEHSLPRTGSELQPPPRLSQAADTARLTQEVTPLDSWREITCWIDKSCVAQQHPIMMATVAHLDAFVRRCEGMIVLFTWDFFKRLWCVYEWSLFLVLHDAEHVQLSVDFFLRASTLPSYVESIRTFRLLDARCSYEEDRVLIEERVCEMYHSVSAFERFAQATAIVLMAVCIAKRAGLSHDPDASACAFPSELEVWAELAEQIDFQPLAAVLRASNPQLLLQRARPLDGEDLARTGLSTTRTWRAKLAKAVDRWYLQDLRPLLNLERSRSVRKDWLDMHSPVRKLSRSGSHSVTPAALATLRRMYNARTARASVLLRSDEASDNENSNKSNRTQSLEGQKVISSGPLKPRKYLTDAGPSITRGRASTAVLDGQMRVAATVTWEPQPQWAEEEPHGEVSPARRTWSSGLDFLHRPTHASIEESERERETSRAGTSRSLSVTVIS